MYSLISRLDMKRIPISVAENRDSLNPQPPGGPDDPACYLTSICNQNLVDARSRLSVGIGMWEESDSEKARFVGELPTEDDGRHRRATALNWTERWEKNWIAKMEMGMGIYVWRLGSGGIIEEWGLSIHYCFVAKQISSFLSYSKEKPRFSV